MRTDKSLPKNEKETLDYIDNSADQLDEMRLAGLKEEKNTQLIKDEIWQREKKRMEVKHGKTHPEVQEADNRIAYNNEMYTGLDMEVEKASIKTDPFPYNSWRVNGKVFDKKIVPVKGVTVYLSDQNKKWIEKLGNSCTNEKGFYSLTVDAALVAGYEKKRQPLYVSVSDKNKKLLYMASEPLYAHKGLIDYLDIFLNDKECVSPPPGTDDKEKKAAQ